MFLATLKTLAKEEILQVVSDLSDQMGGFEKQWTKEAVCIQDII